MARPRTFEQADVLDRAMDVFCRHGYEGATMAELTAAMGLTPPSIYAAFGNKRGLFDAVLDRYSICEKEHRDQVLSAPTAREVVERFLHGAAEAFPKIGGPPGYILIQAGLAVGSENADIPEALARRRQANELSLRDRFELAKVNGDLPAGTDVAGLASYVTAVFDGLAIKASGGASASVLRKIADHAMANWQAQVDASKSPTAAVGSANDNRRPDGRGRPRVFNETDALDGAMEVFWRKGYEGASLADLTEAMGITRPSLYATFGNKEALFLKALNRYQSEKMAYAIRALEAPTAREVAEQILTGAVAAQTLDCQPRGCLFVVNSLQGSDEAKVIRAEVLRRAAAGHELIVSRLERAKADGDLPGSVNAKGLAMLLGSTIQGIMTMGASGASEDELRALADAMLALWPMAEPADT